MTRSIRIFAFLPSIISSFALANDDPLDTLFDLPLEELINIEVSIASSGSDTVSSTPAIVSRYNRIDLEKMGISNLREMFNFIPGVIVQDSLTGFASVQIRGIDETFNQKVLFLLNGVPYHQPSHSIIPMEGIPWESISHIEVIRGPGAVFHGTQASGGVFNVITKKDIETSSASLKTGSHGLVEGSAYYSNRISQNSNAYFAAEYRTEDGYDERYEERFPDVGIVSDEVKRYLKRKSILAGINNHHLDVFIQAFTDETVGINDNYTDENTLQPFIVKSQAYLVHAENSWVTNNTKTTIFSDYNHYTFDLQINNLFAPEVDALITKDNNGKKDYRFRIGGTVLYTINPSINVFGGIENEVRSNDNYRIYFLDDPDTPLATPLENNKFSEDSAYLQTEYTLDQWRFILGARYTNNELSGEKVTPRAGIIVKLDENQSFKALYSTGFNSPNPTQTSISVPGDTVGNTDLQPEIVETYDLAYTYTRNDLLVGANVYYLKAEDFIIRRFSDEVGAVSFFNEGTYNRTGAELDIQLANPHSRVFANLAYQREGNKIIDDDPDAFRAPRLTLSLGASINVKKTHSIGGNLSHIGARHNLPSYNVINLNYTAQFSSFEIFAIARNIFGEDILNPNIIQGTDLVAPGENGPNFQLGGRIHF